MLLNGAAYLPVFTDFGLSVAPQLCAVVSRAELTGFLTLPYGSAYSPLVYTFYTFCRFFFILLFSTFCTFLDEHILIA